MGPASVEYDCSVPALLFKIGYYPISHGTLGAIRSLGRASVSVYAISEDRFVPHASSRFLAGQIVLPTTGRESMDAILGPLMDIGRRLGRPSVLLPTDDEAAVFAAEHRQTLRGHFILPAVAPELPRYLASKRNLSEICIQHGIATPVTSFARTIGDVRAFAAEGRFPIVVKNSEPWIRITAPAVKSTKIVETRDDLLVLAATWPADPHVILQEYIPEEYSEDWIFHAYFDCASNPLVAFTGRKQRSWPPHAGVTTAATALQNEELQSIATEFCRAIGYCGIVDMDWRRDLRDGRYKLVDFNPRIGANFRLFINSDGIDVVRAAHLDLTGRRVPQSPQVLGRTLIVENLDLASQWGRRAAHSRRAIIRARRTELAWFAIDDPLPFFVMAVRFLAMASSVCISRWFGQAAAAASGWRSNWPARPSGF